MYNSIEASACWNFQMSLICIILNIFTIQCNYNCYTAIGTGTPNLKIIAVMVCQCTTFNTCVFTYPLFCDVSNQGFGKKSGKILKCGLNLPRKRAHYTKLSVSYQYAFHIWKKADLIGGKKFSHFEHLCHYVTPSWTLAGIETGYRQANHDTREKFTK